MSMAKTVRGALASSLLAVALATSSIQAQAAAMTEKERQQQRAARLSALIARKEEKISKD